VDGSMSHWLVLSSGAGTVAGLQGRSGLHPCTGKVTFMMPIVKIAPELASTFWIVNTVRR
jgi:hypothetical protein